MSIISDFLNPVKICKGIAFNRKNKRYDRSSYDLELWLYSKILRNDMLHWGYFENPKQDPADISVLDFEKAQIRYAEKIIEHLKDLQDGVLDVGCGMGGLSSMLKSLHYDVEALTPNKNQIEHIRSKYPSIPVHCCRFEDLKVSKQFGTIINSESLQYIRLGDAFDLIEKHLLPDGRWIVVDYFRLSDQGINKSSHLLDSFLDKVKENRFKIVYQEDITPYILPTARFLMMYAERFLLPLVHFGFEKLRYKKGFWYYMTQKYQQKIDKKIQRELAGIDPVQFASEKRYMLYVLEKCH